MSQTIHTA